MVFTMTIKLALVGDELFPIRFLDWLASEMEAGDCGADYPDEKATIEVVEVNGHQVIPPVDRPQG